MIKTTGIFYDGISSVPHKIDIAFDEYFGQFSFDFPIDQLKIWKVKDLAISQVGATLHIHFDKLSMQSVKIDDVDFITALNVYLNSNGHLSLYQKLFNLGFKIHIAIALVIIGIIALAYIYVIPWVGEKSVVLIPQEYDYKLGGSFYEEFCDYNTIDSAATAEMNLFAKQLDFNNQKEIRFTVIESSTINAFALPDGNIIIYTGILEQMKTYDELVALMSHEVVHVNNRHSMKMMCRNLSGYIFISAVLSDVNGIMAIIGDNVHNLQSLSYSRQFEREADSEGLQLMISNNINPRGMTNLFTRLQASGETFLPEFLSSHPITEERLLYIDEMIKSESFTVKEHKTLQQIFAKINSKH